MENITDRIIEWGKMTGDSIANYTAEGKLRVDMEFGIGYGDDIRKAKKILENLSLRMSGSCPILLPPWR